MAVHLLSGILVTPRVTTQPWEASVHWPKGPVTAEGRSSRGRRGFREVESGNLRGEASLLKALLVPAGAGLLRWEAEVGGRGAVL